MMQAAKIIGTSMATTGLIGVGIGIDPSFFIALTMSAITLGLLICLMPMPGVRCPRCAEHGKETWVLPGKHCPVCGQPC